MTSATNLLLLADRNSNAWDFTERIKDHIQEKESSEIPIKEVSIRRFRNGEVDMHIPDSIRRKNVYFVHDSTKDPQSWWAELLLLQSLVLDNSAESISFVLPNLLYSRQDRRDKPHVPISARVLADSLMYSRRILTMDLHSPQIQGFYPPTRPLENLYSFTEVISQLRSRKIIPSLEELVLVSPDAGGVKRVEVFANKLKPKYRMAFLEKRRDSNGNREVNRMSLIGSVREKDVLIIDDVIDSGGTLCKAASVLKNRGAKKLYCYGTHGLFTEGTDKLSKYFEKIMISNTHNEPRYRENDRLEIIDVSSIFAEAIYRIEKGVSLSSLFK